LVILAGISLLADLLMFAFLEAAFQGMWQELGLALEEFLFAQ